MVRKNLGFLLCMLFVHIFCLSFRGTEVLAADGDGIFLNDLIQRYGNAGLLSAHDLEPGLYDDTGKMVAAW